jgi:hypothetical protein
LNKSINQDKESMKLLRDLCKQGDEANINNIKVQELKVPANLKPIEWIFKRNFSGLYYNEKQNLFYSIYTLRKSRIFCSIKWGDIIYRGLKGSYEPGKYHPIKKTYRYVSLPVGDGTYFRLSENA